MISIRPFSTPHLEPNWAQGPDSKPICSLQLHVNCTYQTPPSAVNISCPKPKRSNQPFIHAKSKQLPLTTPSHKHTLHTLSKTADGKSLQPSFQHTWHPAKATLSNTTLSPSISCLQQLTKDGYKRFIIPSGY